MQVLYPRCAGLDMHKDTIVACVRCVSPPMHQEVRSFGTTTTELLALADWLAEHDCTHVAMEATGVYWKPVWHVLEDEFELVLANAAHIRNVPGRKTDVNDAMSIADLLAHGLIRSSFVPPQSEKRRMYCVTPSGTYAAQSSGSLTGKGMTCTRARSRPRSRGATAATASAATSGQSRWPRRR